MVPQLCQSINPKSDRLLEKAVGYKPATPVREGVANFVAWYRAFYQV